MIKKLESLAAAVAFAEAGLLDEAKELACDIEVAAKSPNRKFLIVSENRMISKNLVTYAMQLSERMQYDIVATHAINEKMASGLAEGGMKQAVNRLAKDFLALYRELAAHARMIGVECHHLLSKGSAYAAIENVYHHVGGVEFAIVQGSSPLGLGVTSSLPLFVFKEDGR